MTDNNDKARQAYEAVREWMQAVKLPRHERRRFAKFVKTNGKELMRPKFEYLISLGYKPPESLLKQDAYDVFYKALTDDN